MADAGRDIHSVEPDRSPWPVIIILALITFFDGYDVFAPAYVIPVALKEWALRPSEAGLLVSSGLVGFTIGSLGNGPIADRIGRKPALCGALAAAAALTFATSLFAHDFTSFLILRLLTGIGLGMLLPLAVTLVNELAPKRLTNVLVGIVMAGWSSGGIAASLAGAALVPHHGWPALFWIGVPALIVAVIATFVIPESPQFRALAERRATGTQAADASSFAKLLAPELRGATCLLGLCSACSLFVIYGLSGWVPQAMIARGESFGASFAFGALLQFAAVLGGLGCGFAADRAGARPTLVASWTVGCAAIAGLALLNGHVVNLSFVAIAGFCLMGAQPVLNNLAASLYPTAIRSTGVGAELGVGRLGGILGPYVGGWLQEIVPGTVGLFAAMALAAGISALAMAFAWPVVRRAKAGN